MKDEEDVAPRRERHATYELIIAYFFQKNVGKI